MAAALALACSAESSSFGIESAADGSLLDDEAGVARVQVVDDPGDAARLLDDVAQVAAGPHLARAQRQHRFIETRVDQVVLERALVLEVGLRLALAHFVERRLGDVEVALVHQLGHLPVEEGEQQGADVGAVDVGVRHDDDLVVAQLRQIEVVAADAGAERGDEGADLLARQHLVEAGPLHVEDLAAQRQHRLELAVAALLGRAAGRVALDDEHLGVGRVAVLAFGELARQRVDVERTLAPRQLARLARGLAGGRRLHHLGDDDLGFLGVLLEPGGQLIAHDALHHRLHLGGDELVLGLAGELGVRHLDGQHRGEPLAGVVAGDRHLLLLGDAALVGVLVDDAGERCTEAGEVRAAVALGNVVGEAQHVLVVGVVPPQRHFHAGAVLVAAAA